jgi:hypothetical protein
VDSVPLTRDYMFEFERRVAAPKVLAPVRAA